MPGWLPALGLGCALFCAPAGLSAAPELRPTSQSLDAYFAEMVVAIHKTALESGLRVVLEPRRNATCAAVSLTLLPSIERAVPLALYLGRLGLTEDQPGAPALLAERGARSRSDFGLGHMSFSHVLPATEIEAALWFEAKRLRALAGAMALRPAVLGGRAQPLMPAELAALTLLRRLMFEPRAPASEPNWWQKLETLPLSTKDAVLAIAGDFDSDRVLELVRKHFDEPKGTSEGSKVAVANAQPAAGGLPAETPGAGQTGTSPSDASAWFGFRAPALTQREYLGLLVASQLLLHGGASRARANFLKTARATRVSSHVEQGPGYGALWIRLDSQNARTHAESRRALFDRIEALTGRAPNTAALEVAKKAVLVSWLDRLVSPGRRARLLSEYEALYGDARLLTRQHNLLAELSASEVWQMARNTLDVKRAFVLAPAGAAEGTP